MAALIKDALDADTEIVPGSRGEFSVWVDDKKVAEKTRKGFPDEKALIETVKTALE